MVDYISTYTTEAERKAIIAKEESLGLRMKHDNHVTRVDQVQVVADFVEDTATGEQTPIMVNKDVTMVDHGVLVFTDEPAEVAPNPMKAIYAALTTDAERIAFLARRQGLL